MVHVTPTPILVGERIQQLDMLMHIQEFSSMVAVITGKPKMGKTALIETAASQLSIHHQVISFSAAEIQSESDVVQFVSQQLGVENNWHSIEQSLINIHAQSESVNVLIDDAHLLSYELLEMLSVRAIQEDGWHLVLAGDNSLFENLNRIQHDLHHTNLIHHLDLLEISQEEAIDLAAEFFKKDGHESVPISNQRLAQLWQVSHGAPGAMLDLLNAEKDQNMAEQAKFPFGHVAAICLIAVALTFSYLYQDDAAVEHDAIDSIIASQALDNASQLSTIKKTEPLQNKIESINAAKQSNGAVVNQNSLSRSNALIKPPTSPLREISTKPKAQYVASKNTPASPLKETKNTANKVIETAKPKAAQIAAVKAKINHPLLNAPSNGFALQLLGVRSKTSAQAVLNDFKGVLGADKLSVYETTYKGQPWFVVVYGPMNNKAAANQKAGALAKRLKNQPWVRPMARIQEDIRKIQP